MQRARSIVGRWRKNQAFSLFLPAPGAAHSEEWSQFSNSNRGPTVYRTGKPLPPGQDIQGRLWNVIWLRRCGIRGADSTDRVRFRVSVWNGNWREEVELWSLFGPGDEGEPVVTIMLEGED